MYPVRKSAKSKLSIVLTFVLIFCVNVLFVCGSEETTTLQPDADVETPTEIPTETPAEKRSDNKNGVDALEHRMLEDINISLELPNSHRLVIEGGEVTESTIKAEESKPGYTVWNYKPKSSLEHSTKYKLKDTFEISKYQNDLKASASSKKEVTSENYPDDFFGPNPAQNGIGKKVDSSREKQTPATDRVYGKFGTVWNKRPIIPIITKHTTIVAPDHHEHGHGHHHHHIPHGWGWRPRKRPHKIRRPRYRHYGRPKRYRHARRHRPHHHHYHHHHNPGWHGHGHGHKHSHPHEHKHSHGHGHGHVHEHGHGHGHGWKKIEDYHTMPSYAPAYISYGPFYKLPPGVKLDSPAYIAPASTTTSSHTHSNYRSHSKYPPGLNHMDTPHVIDKPTHSPHKEPFHSHGHHHLKHYHSMEHYDDHRHNSLEYGPPYDDHGPPYDDYSHSHSHENPTHIPYRHVSYGREMGHDRPRPHHMDHHHPHPHHFHPSNEMYSHEHESPTGESGTYLNDAPPPHFYSRDNRPKINSENHGQDSPNLPGYGTPEASKNYEPPMNFGHPMHNFGPPMSSFGQPPPTFGPPHGDEPLGHLPPPKDNYLPEKDYAEGKNDPIVFGSHKHTGHQNNNLVGSGPPNDFGQPNFFDKPFKHLISSTNNFQDNKHNIATSYQKNEGNSFFNKGKGNYFNPYPTNPDSTPTTLPPLIAYEDNLNSFSHKSPSSQVPNPPYKFQPSKPIDPFPPPPQRSRNGRPPPKFNTQYNSPGMSKDPKVTDWFHFAKRRRHEKILLGYPLEEKRKSTKFSTLPEPFKVISPDPIHRKLPKITYDNMNKRISMPRASRRRPAGKRPRHRDLLTKETQDVPLTEDTDNHTTKDELEESNKIFDTSAPDSQTGGEVSLTLKSEQGFQDMLKAHKKLIDS